jgi:prepilin-type N-terminal cleavage/methylation domain-containing protein
MVTVSRLHQRALSLLELLLVLAIAGILITVSIRSYRQYEQRSQIARVKNDVAMLYAALSHYYFETGCNSTTDASPGQFKGDKTPAINNLPVLTGVEALPTEERPIVSAFHVAIVDTNTLSAGGKHVYTLQVTADISGDAPLPAARYAMMLHATVSGNTLAWNLLPSLHLQDTRNPLWILNAIRRSFQMLASGDADQNCVD